MPYPFFQFIHLMQQGFLDAHYKEGWSTYLAYFAKVLKRTKLSRKVLHYDTAEQHYYFVARGALLCMLRAYRKHADYTAMVESGATSQEELTEGFMKWCELRMSSGDEQFRYYASQTVFGVGIGSAHSLRPSAVL